QQENQPLKQGDARASQDFAEHHRPAGDGCDEYSLQKPFASVLDDGNRGENGGEQQNENQAPSEVVFQETGSVLARGGEAEGILESCPEQQPEEDRRADGADDAIGLAEETEDFSPGQRSGRPQRLRGERLITSGRQGRLCGDRGCFGRSGS